MSIINRASRRKIHKYKKNEINFNDDIMFKCSRCSYLLLSWFDGIEYDISSLNCENCNEVYPLKDLFIKHKDEIEKRLLKEYGYTPLNLQGEFDKILREAGFTWDKSVFEENMKFKKDSLLKKLRIMLLPRKNFF